jgi:uncharacterized membrane protein YecN with MAPEG domain
MPLSEICLIVCLIFAVIHAWPVWGAPYAPWRPSAFALSWLFFVLWIVLGHGGINTHG